MKPPKKRVVIVDDHPMLRERLALLLTQELDMETCGEAEDTPTALKIIHELQPDLVILDVTLRGSSGIDLIKQLAVESSKMAILVLSMHEETMYAERVLRAGAGGYITKHESTDEIAVAIRKVLDGEVYLSKGMVAGVLKSMTVSGAKGKRSPVDRLADRELEVFTLFGRGHTLEEIAQLLDVAPATVCSYRTRIKTKMGIGSASELQHIATKWVCDNDRE